MTREEELDWLCRLRSEIYVYMPKEWLIPMNNALDMAISALSENKGDTISRALYEQIVWERDTAIQQLKDLGYGLGEKPKENKGDLISRQAVLDEMDKRHAEGDCITKGFIKALPSAENKGEYKHGHWIKINSGDEDFPESIICDRCNHENSHLDFNEHNEPIGKVFVTSNFCPNCGADMREPKGKKGTT